MKNTVLLHRPWPWRVDYWPANRPFSPRRGSKKFRTEEEAWHFVNQCYDDGLDTETWEPGARTGNTWNGQGHNVPRLFQVVETYSLMPSYSKDLVRCESAEEAQARVARLTAQAGDSGFRFSFYRRQL